MQLIRGQLKNKDYPSNYKIMHSIAGKEKIALKKDKKL